MDDRVKQLLTLGREHYDRRDDERVEQLDTAVGLDACEEPLG